MKQIYLAKTQTRPGASFNFKNLNPNRLFTKKKSRMRPFCHPKDYLIFLRRELSHSAIYANEDFEGECDQLKFFRWLPIMFPMRVTEGVERQKSNKPQPQKFTKVNVCSASSLTCHLLYYNIMSNTA